MVKDLKILKTDEFYKSIEAYAKLGIPYIEAIIKCSEDYGIEVETAAELIKKNPKIKSAIQIEGEESNLLTKTNRLPV